MASAAFLKLSAVSLFLPSPKTMLRFSLAFNQLASSFSFSSLVSAVSDKFSTLLVFSTLGVVGVVAVGAVSLTGVSDCEGVVALSDLIFPDSTILATCLLSLAASTLVYCVSASNCSLSSAFSGSANEASFAFS